MNHLTPLWPPRSHGGSPSLWNLSLCIKNLCPCNWMESAGLVGCCKHLSSIFGVVNVPHCGLNCQYKTYGYIFTAILFSNDMVLYFISLYFSRVFEKIQMLIMIFLILYKFPAHSTQCLSLYIVDMVLM